MSQRAAERRTDDIRIAFAPYDAYGQAAVAAGRTTWPTAFRRPLLAVVLVGTSVAIAASGPVTPSLLVATMASWSWVVLVQLAIAAVMTRPLPPRGHLSAARAFELWFAAHIPWTAWLLVLGPVLRLVPDLDVEVIIVSMLAPMGWTAWIAVAFSRIVLGQSAVVAAFRAAVHQAALLFVILSFVAWASGGWFRIIG